MIIPSALRESACAISQSGGVVRIDCDTPQLAAEVFDWLTSLTASPDLIAWLRDKSNHRHPDWAFAAVLADRMERGEHLKDQPA